MEKRLCVISACYARKDIDGTVLGYTVWVKEVNAKSDYTYRFDYGPASMQKTFNVSDEAWCNRLIGKECYIKRFLELK